LKLTPLEVKKQEFKKAMRGFDPDEVNAFLEMVSEELESLIREKNQLTDEVLKLRTQLRDYQNVEKTLQETLVSAQESIKESKQNTTRQAEMIVREAELKAEKILEDAKLRLAEMKNELVVVRAQKDSFARRLKHLLESQLDLITVLELDDLGFNKYEHRGTKPKTKVAEKIEQVNEELEFEGIDDTVPEETKDDALENPEKSEPEEPHGIKWGKRHAEDFNIDKDDDEEKPPQSRISDKLIF
jgi:cell division initiation protein